MKKPKLEMKKLSFDKNNIEIMGKNQNCSLIMYIDKDIDQKTFVLFIKKVERFVRSSSEYKEYVKYLREEKGQNKCAYLSNITTVNAEIQLHHVISNLFMICSTVCNKLLSEDKKVSSFILADEVIKLHLDDKIALVPLSVTMHELAHSVDLKIPLSVIYGKYREYYEEFEPYMDKYEKKCFTDIFELEYLTNDNVLRIEYCE